MVETCIVKILDSSAFSVSLEQTSDWVTLPGNFSIQRHIDAWEVQNFGVGGRYFEFKIFKFYQSRTCESSPLTELRTNNMRAFHLVHGKLGFQSYVVMRDV